MFVFRTHFLRRPSTGVLETFPHDVALAPKEALLCRFPESALNKNEGRKKLKFRPISRLTATY